MKCNNNKILIMYKIYCIKDINGLCYIGKTKLSLKERLRMHRYDRDRGHYCSSQKLNLYNCEIILLEECDKSISSEREQYWINNTDCVNDHNAIFNKKEYHKQYNKQWNIDNKEKRKEYQKQYCKQRKQYQKSWGGRPDISNNSLLNIDIDLFQ